MLALELRRCSSDLGCPGDHVPDWQPHILLGMVEVRSVNNVKNTHTQTYETSRGDRNGPGRRTGWGRAEER